MCVCVCVCVSDINECLEGEFCFPKGECVNTAGSYTCVCSQGYTLSDNRTACIGESQSVCVCVCTCVCVCVCVCVRVCSEESS